MGVNGEQSKEKTASQNLKQFWANNRVMLLIIAVVLAGLIWTSSTGNGTNIEGAPDLQWKLAIVLLLTGLMAGWLGGLIGTGGCAIILPVFTFWLGFSAPAAIGTTLFVVIFTALSGGYGHFKNGNTDMKIIKWMAPSAVVGVLAGSYLFTVLAEQTALICLILGIIFLIPSGRMVWEGFYADAKKTSAVAADIKYSMAGMIGFAFVVGLLSGLVGLGGGYLLVPGLIYLFKLPVYLAMGTSLAVVFPLALVGGILKASQGFVALQPALLAAAGTIVGAQISAKTIKKYKPSTLKLIFGLYFLYAAMRFIVSFTGV